MGRWPCSTAPTSRNPCEVRNTATLSGQSQKEFYVNEAHALIDALLHAACEGEAATPPVAPAEGEAWLVASGATGEWVGEDGKIASRQSGNWLFTAPTDGMRMLDRSTGQLLLFHGGWRKAVTPPTASGGTVVDAEARTAIADLIAALTDAGILASS